MKWFSVGALSLGCLVLVSLYGLSLSATDVSGKKEAEFQELHELRRALQTREKSLVGRESVLQKREADIKDRELILQQQVARYEKIISDLNKKLKSARKYEAEQVDAVKGIYEKMDPKKAAKVLDKMDTSSVATLLSDMRKEQAAEILGKMTSANAKQVSERMLERRLGSVTFESKQ